MTSKLETDKLGLGKARQKQKAADMQISDTEPNINIVALTRKVVSLT